MDLESNTWIPKKLPILRMEDYHTHFLGKTVDGRQFFGYQTFTFPKGISVLERSKHRKEYVVLYIFDEDGNHLVTNHWYAGTGLEVEDAVIIECLEQMVKDLGETVFCDIEVKPFHTVIDGIVFGLVADEKSRMIVLQPSSTISFQEPWDGEYYT